MPIRVRSARKQLQRGLPSGPEFLRNALAGNGTLRTRAISTSCRQFDLTKLPRTPFVRVPGLRFSRAPKGTGDKYSATRLKAGLQRWSTAFRRSCLAHFTHLFKVSLERIEDWQENYGQENRRLLSFCHSSFC